MMQGLSVLLACLCLPEPRLSCRGVIGHGVLNTSRGHRFAHRVRAHAMP